ncbi:MAG: DUF4105 domain-containing protein [Myxococcales bacterium]|nr:DUF4105 domain-containing protein [Polyangiaceae bacterium]MDW8249218.1 DUF4105 domain-containing protein [Myxococcales bacterium]
MRTCILAMALGAMALLTPVTSHAELGDEYTISVLTFGPGDHPFFKFGHNAIWVHDARRHTDRVYNFGTFAFDSPALIPVFLKGKLRYWLSVQSLRSTIEVYRRENRTIDAQELALSPPLRKRIVDALEENAKPENRYYKYDYYRDNCSTRVRDAVDQVTGGKVREAAGGPARMTWRAHTMRLVADDWPVYLGLQVAMGDMIDKPITVWDEMFLPARLQEMLREVKIPGEDGQSVPLVRREHRILEADRPPVRSEPPKRMGILLVVGAVLGGGLAALGLAARRKVARVVLGLGTAVLGFLLGLLGLIFLMFWTYTDHEVAHHNENLLQCVPWAVAMAWLGVGVARGKGGSTRRAYQLALAALGASTLGLVLKGLPWFDQKNEEIIALLWPIWAGMTCGLRWALEALAGEARRALTRVEEAVREQG